MALRLTYEQKERLVKHLEETDDDTFFLIEVNGVFFRLERGEEEALIGLIQEHGQKGIKIICNKKKDEDKQD